MYTCYLFADKFDDENCLSIRLADSGEVINSLEIRTLDEFRVLQQNSKTVIVLSSELVSIYSVDAPVLSSSKARPAISYALEEKLADNVAHLHFSFDKNHYFSGKYLVVVVEKNVIFTLQNRLDNLQIEYNEIVCDWFALDYGESCVISNRYVVNDANFQGALDLDLFEIYLKSQTSFSHIKIFNDSPVLPHSEKFSKIDNDSYIWLAQKLQQQNPINLCQGEFAHNTNTDVSRKYLKIACIIGLGWLSIILTSYIIKALILNHEISVYDKKIAALYRKFFPDAKQVINPKFRITQILQKNQVGINSPFWQVLAKFSDVIEGVMHGDKDNGETVTIEKIIMQNNKLIVNVICQNFDILEKIEMGLKTKQINLHKSGVVTKNSKVLATLELAK